MHFIGAGRKHRYAPAYGLAPVLVLLASAATAAPAPRANPTMGPTGEWLVENGYAHIKIDNCGESLWGVVSWEKKPGRDTNNPDPSKRDRPTLGLPILLDMKPTEANRWEGEVYNAENGKKYSSSISLGGPDTLRIEGCVLGFLCGGENWTRVKASPDAAKSGEKPSPKSAAKPAARAAKPAARDDAPPLTKEAAKARSEEAAKIAAAGGEVDVCSIVGRAPSVRVPGAAHEGRLK